MSFNDPAAFLSGDSAAWEGPGLRPLTWHGLCARITAAQDLRRAFEAMGNIGHELTTGSFHGATAALIASNLRGVPAHEDLVNPMSSANGKAPLGTSEGLTTQARQDRSEARD